MLFFTKRVCHPLANHGLLLPMNNSHNMKWSPFYISYSNCMKSRRCLPVPFMGHVWVRGGWRWGWGCCQFLPRCKNETSLRLPRHRDRRRLVSSQWTRRWITNQVTIKLQAWFVCYWKYFKQSRSVMTYLRTLLSSWSRREHVMTSQWRAEWSDHQVEDPMSWWGSVGSGKKCQMLWNTLYCS